MHGLLYHSYRNAVGGKLFAASYRPLHKGWYTWTLWFLTAIMLTMPFAGVLTDMELAKWSPLLTAFLLITTYFPVANLAIHRGLSDEYAKNGVNGKCTQQPTRLVRELLHHLWFSEKVNEIIKPTKLEIEQCIEFIDSNSKLPVSNEFLRHPLVILVIGLFGYAINASIPNWIKRFGNELQFLVGFSFVIAFILYVGWFFYSMRSAGDEDNWRFKRCLKWYLLQQYPTLEKKNDAH